MATTALSIHLGRLRWPKVKSIH